MSEGIRVSFDLVGLINLNLVRRRLATIAHGDAFVAPEELRLIVDLLDSVLGDDFEAHLHELRRRSYGA